MGAAKAEFTEKNYTAIDMENPQMVAGRTEITDRPPPISNKFVMENKMLVKDIAERSRNLSPPPSYEMCIYRVPEIIRKLDEAAYTPVVVSIGPYHHDNPNLQFMEDGKWRYFRTFIGRSGVKLKRYVDLMKKNEERARAYYAETIDMPSDKFVTMILVDGCFILELVRQYSEGACFESKLNKFIRSKNWLISRILHDLILLENQIPFFILESIYHLAVPYGHPNELYYSILVFFKSQNNQNKYPDFRKVMHFTDLIRELYLPLSEIRQNRPADSDSEIKFVYTATQLHEAGVKFKEGSSKCLLDVKFTGGVLQFPRLPLQHETKYIFRNLMALEVCHYSHATPIIDYVVFLDSLIDTPKDVDLLAKMGMLYNGVGSTSAAADIVNNLCTEVTYYSKNSYLILVCKDLNAYYNLYINRWRAVLKHDYFRTPWRTASTLAAIMLLLLTSIQTVYSVLSFYRE